MQYNDLLKKKKIVENDKAKIAELIEELDQKKNEALRGAYRRVNKVSVCRRQREECGTADSQDQWPWNETESPVVKPTALLSHSQLPSLSTLQLFPHCV